MAGTFRRWPGWSPHYGALPSVEEPWPLVYPRGMPTVDIGAEVAPKKTFVWAIDWPGWCRSGKDRDLAIDALVVARARYAKVARRAGLDLPQVDPSDLR